MRLRKVISYVLAGTMALSLLTGCGSAGDNQKEINESNSSLEAAGNTNADESTVTVGYNQHAIEDNGDITITMMYSGTPYENDFETESLPELVHEKWPNVTLEVTKLPDDNYYTTLKTKLASGECSDIILVQPKTAGTNGCYNMAEAGYLASLDDLSILELMSTSGISAMTYKDHVYAVPGNPGILGTYYNKDMFSKYNLEEPTTWDEFLKVCQTLKDNGIQPITMGDKDQYVMYFGLFQLACNEVYAKSQNFDDQLYTGETSFTDEGTWDKVAEMYNELYKNGYIDISQSLGIGASQAIQQFIDGEAAMTFDGSFNATALRAEGKISFERGYFPLPGETENGTVYTAVSTSAGPAIYSGSEYIDECKEIIDWWMDGESAAYKAMIDTGRNISTYGYGADKVDELFVPFIESYNRGESFYWCNQAWPSGVDTELTSLISEMAAGQITAKEVAKGMQEKFEDLTEE